MTKIKYNTSKLNISYLVCQQQPNDKTRINAQNAYKIKHLCA